MPKKTVTYKQSGGMYGTPLPSEYFGNNSNRYFEAGSPQLGDMIVSKTVEPNVQNGGMNGNPLPSEYFGNNSNRYFEAGSPELGDMIVSNTVEPGTNQVQNGGSNKFNYIVNPTTGKKVSLFSKTGKNVLKNYISSLD